MKVIYLTKRILEKVYQITTQKSNSYEYISTIPEVAKKTAIYSNKLQAERSEDIMENLGKKTTEEKGCRKYKNASTQDNIQQFEIYAGRVLYSKQPPQQSYLQNP